MLSLLFSLLFRVDRKDCIFYTRDEYILPLLQKFSDQVIWEGHTIPKHTYYYVRYWKRCRKIIAISRGLKNELIQLGIREDKILVAPDGVDLNEFKGITRKKEDARTRLNLPLDSDIVLYNGHLYQWKGAHVLAEAAQFLGGNETVIFCGGTVKEVEEFKTRYKDVKNVIIAGHRPRKEIPLYLKSADVFVLPNSARERISRVYTSPIKLFEYMAARRPIVASDIPAVREILDETSAIFVSPDNPRALAAGIKEALKNRERSHKIAENAYKRVQRFTWIERTHHILSFLRI